jgi:hypothetical protein
MITAKPSSSRRILWLGLVLALSAALAYVLIGLGVLAVGDVAREQDSVNIAFIAAGCYFIGGLLIPLRRRGLVIFGLAMNTLVMLFFFQMYQARPAVVFSPGGLIAKAAQLLLEISLIYLIITDWRKSRR